MFVNLMPSFVVLEAPFVDSLRPFVILGSPFVEMITLFVEWKLPSVSSAIASAGLPLNFKPVSSVAAQLKSSPLFLLLRTNAVHSWRRLLDVRKQSRLLTGIISFLWSAISCWRSSCFITACSSSPSFRARRGADGTPALHAVRLFVRAAAAEQPDHRLHQFVSEPRDGVSADAAVASQTIFNWKFIESLILASWAFLFLIAPLLAAFGLVRDAPCIFIR